MGIALGAAFRGMRPIPEVQFSDFVWPSINQLIGEAARTCYGTNGAVQVPMVIRMPYGGGIRGGLFHSQNVETHFFHTPGLKVVAPSTPYDAKGLLKSAIRDNNPVVFLEHKKTYRLVRGEVPDEEYTLPIGKADVKRIGSNITLVSYGLTLHYCLEAAEVMAAEGVDIEVVDLRTLTPLDTETILDSVKKTGKLAIVHEDNITGGVGAEIAALVAERAFEYLDGPIARICGPDVPTMPFAQTLEDAYMPTGDKIADGLRKLAAY
jgi:2-oxoisovalerate dehydrogenase E1 component beta subunit